MLARAGNGGLLSLAVGDGALEDEQLVGVSLKRTAGVLVFFRASLDCFYLQLLGIWKVMG